MATQTSNLGLTKPAVEDFYDVGIPNENMEIIDAAFASAAKFETAGGTGTAITLAGVVFADGRSKTFVVNSDNNALATTIMGKPLYKPGGTAAPKLVAGKAVTVWYNLSGDCFFIKASAEGDAVAANVLAGKLFSNDDDTGITGTMTNNGAVDVTLATHNQEYTVPAGYHSGLGKVKAIITNLIASVIKAGVTVGGILGTFTADGDAVAANILSGKKAYVNGALVTGNIASKGAATITPGTTNQTIAAGQYLSGIQTISGDADLVNGNIKAGVNIFGVAGNFTADATATVGGILTSQTAYVNGVKLTGTMPNNGAVAITPGTTPQTIAAGYHNGVGSVAGDADLVAANIRNAVNIFGVVGNLNPMQYATGTATASTSYTNFGGINGFKFTFTPGFVPKMVVMRYFDSSNRWYTVYNSYSNFAENQPNTFFVCWYGSSTSPIDASDTDITIGTTCVFPCLAQGLTMNWYALG